MFKFDNVHATTYVDKVLDVVRPAAAPRSARLLEVEGRAGAYYFGTDTKVYEIEARVFIKGANRSDLWSKVRAANAWLLKDDLRKLELDDEPGKYYMAVCDDAIDLEEILEYGFATIKFVVPESYAYGTTKNERITAPAMIFERNSVRYKDDGTQITTNYPYYKTGKYDRGILVEEGTTNLLTTASSPAQEEVNVTAGTDYYLSSVGGSTTIEHKKTETLTKQTLAKEGTDLSATVNASWDMGILTNTEEVYNDYLQLTKSGTDLTKLYNTQADWNNAGHTRSNTTGDGSGNLVLTNLPLWEKADNMSSYTTSGWSRVGTQGTITQNASYVTITGTNVTENIGISLPNNVVYPVTMDFKARVRNNADVYVTVNNGTNYVKVKLITNSDGTADSNWHWYRIIVQNSTTMVRYVDGVQVTGYYYYGSAATNKIQFYIDGSTSTPGTGDFDIDDFYVDYNYDKGAPPANNEFVGTWTSGFQSLSTVKTALSSVTTFVSNFSGASTDYTVTFESQLRINGVTQGWNTVTNNGSITGISKGTDLSTTDVQFRITLKSKDPGRSPSVDYLQAVVNSGYNASGYWESTPVNISNVKKAGSTLISWVNQSLPAGTSVTVETQYSTDGGTTWSTYATATNGASIPGITQTTDLSNARFRYKVTLTTNDVAVTPSVDSLTYSFYTGYKPSETTTLTGVSVDSIGTSSGSLFNWTATTDEYTSVSFEYSLDGVNFTPITNGSSFISNGTSLTGKTLTIRYTLSTTDTRYTPTVSSYTWYIGQQAANAVKPVTSTIRVTPTGVSRWQLEAKPYPTSWHDTGTRAAEVAKFWVPEYVANIGSVATVDMWFEHKSNSDPSARYLFTMDGDVDNVALYRMDGEYRVKVGANAVITWDGSSLSDGFHHAAVRWDENSIDLFIDGTLVGTDDLASPLDLDGATYLYIGCSSDGAQQWNAVIDDVRLSKVARTDQEIADLANSATEATADSQTVALYNLDGTLSAAQTNSVEVSGTAPTFPIFTFTFANSADHARVSNGVDFVLVNRNFVTGDVLVIDCYKQEVTLNGSRSLAMPYVDFDSNFFAVTSESTITADPADDIAVDIEYTERWF
jgi:predicted phage tail component-like protein